MAPRKKPVAKTEESTPVEKVATPSPVKKKDEQKKYTCTKSPLVHPFKNVTIGQLPVELFPDSWLDSQVKVGLLKCQ